MALRPKADTPTGVGVVPPSWTSTAAAGLSTGTMLEVFAVLLTASSSLRGLGAGALVSAHPHAEGHDEGRQNDDANGVTAVGS